MPSLACASWLLSRIKRQRAELRATQLVRLQHVELIPEAELRNVQGLQRWEVQRCQDVISTQESMR